MHVCYGKERITGSSNAIYGTELTNNCRDALQLFSEANTMSNASYGSLGANASNIHALERKGLLAKLVVDSCGSCEFGSCELGSGELGSNCSW